MTHTGKFLKTLTSTLAIALTLSACQDGTEKSDNSVSLQPAETEVEIVEDTIALEAEAGYGKNPGTVFDDSPRHDFENFYQSSEGITITRNVAKADNGETTVDKLEMDYNTYIGLYTTDGEVTPGTTYAGTIRMWSEMGETANIVLQVNSFCTAENPEGSTESFTVTDQPQTLSLSHTYANTQGCALFRITNTTEGGATVYAESATLNKSY